MWETPWAGGSGAERQRSGRRFPSPVGGWETPWAGGSGAERQRSGRRFPKPSTGRQLPQAGRGRGEGVWGRGAGGLTARLGQTKFFFPSRYNPRFECSRLEGTGELISPAWRPERSRLAMLALLGVARFREELYDHSRFAVGAFGFVRGVGGDRKKRRGMHTGPERRPLCCCAYDRRGMHTGPGRPAPLCSSVTPQRRPRRR